MPHPLEFLFAEIERGLAAGLPCISVAAALSIADICSALESPNGEAHGSRYKGWYTTYVARNYPLLTEADCYSVKRGVVHAGRFGPAGEYAKVVFTHGAGAEGVAHNTVAHDALHLDATRVCRDFIAAARTWHDEKHADANVVANLARLLTP